MYKISCKKCVYFLLIVILVFLSSYATAFHTDRLTKTTRNHQQQQQQRHSSNRMSSQQIDAQDFRSRNSLSSSSDLNGSPVSLQAGDPYLSISNSDLAPQWYQQYGSNNHQQTSPIESTEWEHLENNHQNRQLNHQRRDDARMLQWEDFDGTREDSNANSSPEDGGAAAAATQANLRISMDLNYENSQVEEDETSREDANSSPGQGDQRLPWPQRKSRNKWHFQLPPVVQNEEVEDVDTETYSNNPRTQQQAGAESEDYWDLRSQGADIHLEDAQDMDSRDKHENQRRHVRHSSSTFPHHRQRQLNPKTSSQNLQNPQKIETTRSSSQRPHSLGQRSGRGAPHAQQTRKPNHPRQNNPRFHHQGHQGQQRPCQEQDVARKAYLANTVVEAKVQSMSLRRNVNYSVTFVVKKVHKQNGPPDTTLRLSFWNDTKEENCEPMFVGGGRSRGGGGGAGLVKAQLLQDKTYYLFLDNSGMHNYTVIGTPVQKKKRNSKDLEDIKKVCKNDFVPKPPRAFGLGNKTLEFRENRNDSLRLVCKTRGFPPPVISWRKNGKDIHSHGPLRITYKKKRSTLKMTRTIQESDSGTYECVARGVDGRISVAWAHVKVHRATKNQSECEPKLKGEYCMNGGNCVYFPEIQEYACECPEGYKGQRCDSKEVSDRPSKEEQDRFD